VLYYRAMHHGQAVREMSIGSLGGMTMSPTTLSRGSRLLSTHFVLSLDITRLRYESRAELTRTAKLRLAQRSVEKTCLGLSPTSRF
jgi:hypothetical protein